jgi:imidazolonepropionase-like amidohydrolase
MRGDDKLLRKFSARVFVPNLVLSMIVLHVPDIADGQSATKTPPNSFVIRNTRVFDGATVHKNVDIAVSDGLIQAVGSHLRAEGLLEVDGHGKTVIPGLIDSHVHVIFSANTEPPKVQLAQRDALRFGVTTLVDLTNLTLEFDRWKPQRERQDNIPEADTFSSGVGVTVPGGHPTEYAWGAVYPTLKSPEDAKAFVDQQVAAGADLIKIFYDRVSKDEHFDKANSEPFYPHLSFDELKELIKAAHANGKLIVSHTQTQSFAKEAIEAGLDGFAHMVRDTLLTPEFIRLAKAKGVFFITTLPADMVDGGSADGRRFAENPAIRPFLTDAQWKGMQEFKGATPTGQAKNALANTMALFKAGVPIITGTDAVTAPDPEAGEGAQGASMLWGVILTVRAGLSPTEALASATSVPAKLLRLGNRGEISPGKKGDLILFNADPTVSIGNIASINRIWKNGYVVDRKP